MDALAVLVPLVALIVFAAAAIGWGVDSTDRDPDDARRWT